MVNYEYGEKITSKALQGVGEPNGRFFFFFFLAETVACGSSWTRD